MSAIPIRREQQEAQFCILEVCNTGNTLDPYSDRLKLQGYEVISANNYEEALRDARECHPVLVVVYDEPETNIDAIRWLELQHTDRDPQLATTPLLILADQARVPTLRAEELPDRVIVLPRRSDTLNQMTRTVKRLLRLQQMD
jgi:DNA-binding NtrC family response regulator